jgi:hypothetical protein
MKSLVVLMMRICLMTVGDKFSIQIGPIKHECCIDDESGTIIALPYMTRHRSLYAWLKSRDPTQTMDWVSTNCCEIIHERSGSSIAFFQQRLRFMITRADVVAFAELCNDIAERQPQRSDGDDGAFPRMLFEFLRRMRDGDVDSAVDDLEKIWNSIGDSSAFRLLNELANHAASAFDRCC